MMMRQCTTELPYVFPAHGRRSTVPRCMACEADEAPSLIPWTGIFWAWILFVRLFSSFPCTTNMSASLKPVQRHTEREERRSCYLLSPSYIDEMKVGEEEEEEEMSSDCSSGCQSGWTMYLEQSSSEFCKTVVDEKAGSYEHEEKEEEEEGLSMVSDASSGPPQLRLEDDEHHSRCYRKSNICSWDTGTRSSAFAPPAAMAKDGFKKRRIGDPSSALVDTATSPLFSFSNARSNANLFSYISTSINKEDNFMKPFREHVLDFPCSFSYVHVEVQHFRFFFVLSSLLQDVLFLTSLFCHPAGEVCFAKPNGLPSILHSFQANPSKTS
ncbi:hypothetical protein B296_00050657 [Ensete ventricosum]|uniref:Uncharacterized protein n=1 Tax=Ensete ventricosum TaxID=4639 RepID=A0A426Y507_ENSVE|nr:hypothetical protein B296_00050657 [Ensete ventricosum]